METPTPEAERTGKTGKRNISRSADTLAAFCDAGEELAHTGQVVSDQISTHPTDQSSKYRTYSVKSPFLYLPYIFQGSCIHYVVYVI